MSVLEVIICRIPAAKIASKALSTFVPQLSVAMPGSGQRAEDDLHN
jgi:hypothetical protein